MHFKARNSEDSVSTATCDAAAHTHLPQELLPEDSTCMGVDCLCRCCEQLAAPLPCEAYLLQSRRQFSCSQQFRLDWIQQHNTTQLLPMFDLQCSFANMAINAYQQRTESLLDHILVGSCRVQPGRSRQGDCVPPGVHLMLISPCFDRLLTSFSYVSFGERQPPGFHEFTISQPWSS